MRSYLCKKNKDLVIKRKKKIKLSIVLHILQIKKTRYRPIIEIELAWFYDCYGKKIQLIGKR
jgi:hypothetical protein